jgi:hypothetical protein
LNRCNRSRGFSANFTRHRKIHDNYGFLRGLKLQKLHSIAMVAGGYYFSNPRHSRALEIARSGANERGR